MIIFIYDIKYYLQRSQLLDHSRHNISMKTDSFIHTVHEALLNNPHLPFYVYSATHPQSLKNITITKPTLIFIMRGCKTIGQPEQVTCLSGHFIFLSDHKLTALRNIPDKNEYLAWIIEFDAQDFAGVPLMSSSTHAPYIMGKTTQELTELIEQFVQISKWAPNNILGHRKSELLKVLYEMGHHEIASFGNNATLSFKIHALFRHHDFQNLSLEMICRSLSMSESTLRRKLKSENQSIKDIKDNAQLGYGLHLLQTTQHSIHHISEQCGYQSHSRFTKHFKNRFGLTPSELRKTKTL